MLLGSGAQSVVYRFGHVAEKKFRPSAVGVCTSTDALAEFEFAHKHLVHPNVIRLLALDVSGGRLLMEFVAGCSLDMVLQTKGALEEETVLVKTQDIISGLCCLHKNGIIHRDVKPANVIMNSITGVCKVTDWIGLSAENTSLGFGKPVGTPVFMAPEVAGMPHRHCMSSDTWSLGCTIVNMMSGRLPWADTDCHGRTNEFMVMWRVANGEAPPYDLYSPRIASLLMLCFEPDKNKRLLLQDIRSRIFDDHNNARHI
jgi:mitogen-activated protein kinase kinase kinase